MSAAEKDLARMLVEQLRRPAFDASRFEDEADLAMRKAIAAHEPTLPANGKRKAAADKQPKVVDLMASLRASLEASATKPSAPKRRAATKHAATKHAAKAPSRTAAAARTTKRTPRQRRSPRTAATA